jgi:hypothetical protein
MRIARDTSWHEMRRRFVLGELASSRFGFSDDRKHMEVKALLESGDRAKECEDILRHRNHIDYWVSLPRETQWKIAYLRLTDHEFRRLRTFPGEGWRKHTNGSFRLVDAAVAIEIDPDRDPDVAAVISACQSGELNSVGITLHSQPALDVYTVVEGSARLVALFLCCVKAQLVDHCASDIEVILGVSQNRWP